MSGEETGLGKADCERDQQPSASNLDSERQRSLINSDVEESNFEMTVTVVDVEIDEQQRRERLKKLEIERRPVPNFGLLRSNVYKLFTWIDTVRQWQCTFCTSRYTHSSTGGSSTLIQHLSTKHKDLVAKAGSIENLADPKKKESITCFTVSKTPPQPPTVITKEGFRQKLIHLIVETDLPFTIVENKYFIEYTEYCTRGNENAKLPTDCTIKNWILQEYEKEKLILKEELQANDGKISFIIDGWTSSNQHAFQGVMACWISNDWKLCITPLDLTILHGSHSGKNIAHAFGLVLDDYDLWKKMMAVTCDNASSNNTMFVKLDTTAIEKNSDFVSTEKKIACLAHIANLSCQDIINHILGPQQREVSKTQDQDGDSSDEENHVHTPALTSSFLERIKYAVKKIRSSPQRRDIFKNACKQESPEVSVSDDMLCSDSPTRWNSTLKMLRRLLKYKKEFLQTVSRISALRKYNFEDPEIWIRLELLEELLAPFEEATKMISQSHSPTLSNTSTVFHFLFKHLEQYMGKSEKKFVSSLQKDSNYPDWLKSAAERGWDKLAKYYNICDSLVYVLGTVLDPRYKMQWYKKSWKKQYADAALKTVTQHWTSKYKPKPIASDPVDQGPQLNISKLLSEQMQSSKQADDELKLYLAGSVVHPNQIENIDGVLDWWKAHEGEYPNLARMAKDFLAAPATGVPVERLFSTGPDLLSNRRQSLSAESIQKILCLKQWIKRETEKKYFVENYMEALKYKLGIEDEFDAED